jgi:histone deacetylase 6
LGLSSSHSSITSSIPSVIDEENDTHTHTHTHTPTHTSNKHKHKRSKHLLSKYCVGIGMSIPEPTDFDYDYDSSSEVDELTIDADPEDTSSNSCIEGSTTQPLASTTNNTKERLEHVHHEEMRTGLVFEEAPGHVHRRNSRHRERPERITAIRIALETAGLLERCTEVVTTINVDSKSDNSHNNDDDDGLQFLNDHDFLRVHLPGYMKRLHRLSNCTCHDDADEWLDSEQAQYNDVFLTQHSTSAAKQAAASLSRLVSRVVTETTQSQPLQFGFAVIRPPGHHAEPGMAGGYCLINNVAVAASYAKTRLHVHKIMIVDWDVHHGNGTQSIFWNDPNVLYFSVHRHGRNFFPYLIESSGPTSIGGAEAQGKTVNVGWTRGGMGDDDYYSVWQHLLMPMAREFQPDLVLISAGFDAADGDAGECHVTPACFGNLTRLLKTLNVPMVAALEGGYAQRILGECVTQVVQALLEPKTNTTIDMPLHEMDPTGRKNLQATLNAHRPYWNCLQ